MLVLMVISVLFILFWGLVSFDLFMFFMEEFKFLVVSFVFIIYFTAFMGKEFMRFLFGYFIE